MTGRYKKNTWRWASMKLHFPSDKTSLEMVARWRGQSIYNWNMLIVGPTPTGGFSIETSFMIRIFWPVAVGVWPKRKVWQLFQKVLLILLQGALLCSGSSTGAKFLGTLDPPSLEKWVTYHRCLGTCRILKNEERSSAISTEAMVRCWWPMDQKFDGSRWKLWGVVESRSKDR